MNCALCHKPINGERTDRQITGWERKSSDPSRRSGSDIKLREHTSEVAHSHCVDRASEGIAVGQEALL